MDAKNSAWYSITNSEVFPGDVRFSDLFKVEASMVPDKAGRSASTDTLSLLSVLERFSFH